MIEALIYKVYECFPYRYAVVVKTDHKIIHVKPFKTRFMAVRYAKGTVAGG